jgi:RHS repeat-associated protein
VRYNTYWKYNLYITRLGRELLSSSTKYDLGTNSADFFYIQNNRGDVIMLINDLGSAAVVTDYDVTGQIIRQAPASWDPFGFTGAMDAGSGLWKLGARFYDSGKGSFIQQDRYMGDLGDPLSLNRFVYCGLDPVNYVDPTGFNPILLWLLGFAFGQSFSDPDKGPSDMI